MQSFDVVTNIASPYRIHMFRVMRERLLARGVEFHVHFMERNPQHRPTDWHMDSKDIPFPHTFWRNIGPSIRGRRWHLNTGMVAALAFRKADYLMMGGPWYSFTGICVSLLARRGVGIAWIEANMNKAGKMGGWARKVKHDLLRRFNCVAVPGQSGEEHARVLLGADSACHRIIVLPNIIDETKFGHSGLDGHEERERLREELGIRAEDRLALWPARLISEKGVPEFLSKLRMSDLAQWTVLIVGDGPFRVAVKKTISDRGLSDRVRVIPPLPYSRMPDLYRSADLFLLPSMRDSNPLSVVEAMHSGLPMILSDRVGNHPEALHEGENGWLVDPLSQDNVRTTLRSAFHTPAARLREMGVRSQELAAQSWTSRSAIDTFLNAIPVQG